MADKGPLLTSGIIFYLSIGAAIFQILEEPNWKLARSKYTSQKERILTTYPCLTKEDLDNILKVVSEAAGQGVTITGEKYFNNWDWSNSVIFAATIVTTIGYGNVAPKTVGGRIFCILYGLCGIPLCLTWISELGSFFGDRAKRLSEVLLRKGLSVKKVQLICTTIFLLYGLLVHLVFPPLVLMSLEGWSYLEGLYFSFITLTTVGFGDYVAGVNPDIDYPRLYRVFAEVWIYMGLAWLSLFFSWNVHMVVEAHKVLKKRRQKKHKLLLDQHGQPEEDRHSPRPLPTAVDIFNFMSEKEENYSTVIKEIGATAKTRTDSEELSRSKSCNDLLSEIRTLDHSPRRRRRLSISNNVFIRPMEAISNSGEEGQRLIPEDDGDTVPEENSLNNDTTEEQVGSVFDSKENLNPVHPGPNDSINNEENVVQNVDSVGTRFTISKVVEGDMTEEKDEKG